MATQTPNLHLTKPAGDDLRDINVINDNMDVLDASIKSVQDSISTFDFRDSYVYINRSNNAFTIQFPDGQRIALVLVGSEIKATLYNGANWSSQKTLVSW